MVLPLIWAGLSIAGFLVSWYVYDQQEASMESALSEFQDIVDHLVITDPMTYGQFMGAGGWILILGGFVLLLAFLLIAFPRPKGANRSRRWR